MATQQKELDLAVVAVAAVERLRHRYPTEAAAMMAFLRDDDSAGVLDERDKELINVALAIACQSQWGIPFHVMHAARAGASRQEILEAGFLAAVSRGPLSFKALVPLMRALDEFASDG